MTAHLRGRHPAVMPVDLLTIDDLDVEGECVLLRMDPHPAADIERCDRTGLTGLDRRLRSGLATIDELRQRGARLVLLGERPSSQDSMQPVAERLSRLTGMPVPLIAGGTLDAAREPIGRLGPGEMLMLENMLRLPGETWADPAVAFALADLGDLYVNDAFAITDQRRASTWGVGQLLLSAAGRQLEREVHALTAVIDEPARPLVVALGGTGLRSRAPMLRRLLATADAVCLGGALAIPFLVARGHAVGESLCLPEDVQVAASLLAEDRVARVLLPTDLVATKAWGESVPRLMPGVEVPPGWTALDIGTETSRRYAREMAAAATVLWHGPMGSVERPGFDAGTRALAGALASVSATTIVAGASTTRALRGLGLDCDVGHVSAGGPAMMALLEGSELPGVEVLLRQGREPRKPWSRAD